MDKRRTKTICFDSLPWLPVALHNAPQFRANIVIRGQSPYFFLTSKRFKLRRRLTIWSVISGDKLQKMAIRLMAGRL